MPGILEINRALRDLALCELEGKDYITEKKRKKWEKRSARKDTTMKEVSESDLVNWMKVQ